MNQQPMTSLSIFQFTRLSRLPIVHGVTTRAEMLPGDGDINVAGRLPREDALANRCAWAEEIGVDASTIVTGRQIHGNHVRIVDETHAGCGSQSIEDALPETDALITRSVGLPLLVYTADCVPAIIYDPVEHALGVAHAGWRGTVSNIAGALVSEMVREFGSNPSNLVVGIGPSIGPCCYEVGQEVIDAWAALGLDQSGQAIRQVDSRYHLDLWRANELEFEAAGVASANIEASGICTQCQADRYFSRRAANGHRGLFATIAALSE